MVEDTQQIPTGAVPETPNSPATQADEWNFPALFSAHLKKRTIKFHLGKAPESSVSFRSMDADSNSQYRDAVMRMSSKTDDEGVEQTFWEGSIAKAELVLLCGTICDMEVFFPKDSVDGSSVDVEQMSLPAPGPVREKFFLAMYPPLRAKLVAECKKENGFSPNSGVE